jgi:Na+-transporting NADH:ubiquinone oxidoreductase subunit F
MILKQIHKWVSVIVFVQLFIWMGSGFLLGKVDSNKATGRDTLVRQSPASFSRFYANDSVTKDALKNTFISINALIQQYPLITQIKLGYLFTQPIYKLKIFAGQHNYQVSDYNLVDAITGELIDLSSPVLAAKHAGLITSIAKTSYKENRYAISRVTLLQPPIEDLPRERNAVWQVNIDDESQTSVYIRAQTGDVIAHVNDETRWRDLLLMLHFMDYTQQGSFNNWFIKIFAMLTLLLSSTGLWWIYRLFKDGQIKLTWFIRNKTVVVRSADTSKKQTLRASANSSILNSLLTNNINIQAVCGGGGVCGTCKFKADVELARSAADRKHITQTELDLGYRLACQHLIKEVSAIGLDKRKGQ